MKEQTHKSDQAPSPRQPTAVEMVQPELLQAGGVGLSPASVGGLPPDFPATRPLRQAAVLQMQRQ